jgi:cell division protein FtsW (lipid II flippase)
MDQPSHRVTLGAYCPLSNLLTCKQTRTVKPKEAIRKHLQLPNFCRLIVTFVPAFLAAIAVDFGKVILGETLSDQNVDT